jgi:hypothetical protein
MQHKHIALLIGLSMPIACALAQPTAPETPHLIMWPLSADVIGSVQPDPTSAIPIVRDDANQPRPVNSWNPQTPAAFLPAASAADVAFASLVSDATVGWNSKAHLVLFPRQIACDLFVFERPDIYNGQAPPTNPDWDARTARPAGWRGSRATQVGSATCVGPVEGGNLAACTPSLPSGGGCAAARSPTEFGS